jgi:hypothetical protein
MKVMLAALNDMADINYMNFRSQVFIALDYDNTAVDFSRLFHL